MGGVDGNTWTVDWYADETGFHPSSPSVSGANPPRDQGCCGGSAQVCCRGGSCCCCILKVRVRRCSSLSIRLLLDTVIVSTGAKLPSETDLPQEPQEFSLIPKNLFFHFSPDFETF